MYLMYHLITDFSITKDASAAVRQWRLHPDRGLVTPISQMKTQAKASMTTRPGSWFAHANALRGNRGLVANLGA